MAEQDINYEPKIRHLEMIQGIIDRMARCSFAVKGWTVSLVVGTFVFLKSGMVQVYITYLYLLVIAFYILDSYYLYQEKRFRELYNSVRQLDKSRIDFNMIFESEVDIFSALVSPSEYVFYLSILGFVYFLFRIE